MPKIGDVVKVFDPILWGGKDVGDNSQFWKDAEVLAEYVDDQDRKIIDVRFLHDNRISMGHFVDP